MFIGQRLDSQPHTETEAVNKRIALTKSGDLVSAAFVFFQKLLLLKPMFRGTGYDKNQRTQGDYGSNLYLIEEEA